MDACPMVPVATARTGFEAKVLAARLGCDGIVWQLRGSVDSVYPVGDVEVLVREDDLPLARELLLSDAVEAALDGDIADEPDPDGTGTRTFGIVLVVVTLAVIGLRLAMTF